MSYPFIPAIHSSAGHNLPPTRIVIHGTVSPTKAGNARAVAKYFQSATSGGSAQYVLDPAEIIQCLPDDTVAWHAPPNPHSIGVEFSDWVTLAEAQKQKDPFWVGKTQAQFDARWALPEWDKMLRLGAKLVRDLAGKYSIPITKLSVADLLAGRHGICGHVDVSQAWHQTDHTDPGPSFPWAKFIGYIKGTNPLPTPEIDMPLTTAEKNEIAALSADLTVAKLLTSWLGRSGPSVAVALQTSANTHVDEIAAAIVASLPKTGSSLTAAEIAKAVNDDGAARWAH